MLKNLAMIAASMAAGVGASELVKELPDDAKTMYVTRMCLERAPGDTVVTSGVFAVAQVQLKGGGSSIVSLEGQPGNLSPDQQAAANALMDAFTPAK